jgi:hypothetical protein
MAFFWLILGQLPWEEPGSELVAGYSGLRCRRQKFAKSKLHDSAKVKVLVAVCLGGSNNNERGKCKDGRKARSELAPGIRGEMGWKSRACGSSGGFAVINYEQAEHPKLFRAVELRPGWVSPTMPKTVRDCITSPMMPCHSHFKPP